MEGADVVEVAPTGDGRDGAALQAAVDALSVDRLAAGRDPGGTVVLTTGSFHLDRPVLVRSHVALTGASLVDTRLVGTGRRPVLRFEDGAEGATVEQLTVDGGARPRAGAVATPAVVLRGDSAFCSLRRLRIVDAAGDGLRIVAGAHRHLALDEIWLERCGRHGIVLDAPGGRSLFLSSLAIDGIGVDPAAGSAVALQLGARAQVSQLSVELVAAGQVGVAFGPGSDHSALSPWSIGVADGGRAFRGRSRRAGVVVGVGAVARVTP